MDWMELVLYFKKKKEKKINFFIKWRMNVEYSGFNFKCL